MCKKHVGVIGLAVMGRNLALNIAEHGYSVAVYNRSSEKTNELRADAGGLDLAGTYTIEEFVQALETPRRIILMVKAGDAVDQMIGQLLPLLDKGDLIIDCGNSYYADTVRRNRELRLQGFHYMGTGVSGGEEGARRGPAIMPGGEREAYRLIEPVFMDISAKVDGVPCCTYIGSDGAGHFVKMVHNGIEYADMQLICEAYSLLKNVLGMSADEMYSIFSEWNKGELNSYLIEITADLLTKIDEETGNHVVDMILDVAGQKGTGKWTSQSALDMGVPAPTITEAVFQRYLSAMKEERVAAAGILKGPEASYLPQTDRPRFIESVRRALYASKICSYAQGFHLIQVASQANQWGIDAGNVAMIFRGGCIIRAQFLNRIMDAYDRNPGLQNLLVDDYFMQITGDYQSDWRDTIIAAVSAGIPVPGFSSALAYYDSYRAQVLPMNLLQAQRDYFGAHTYQRIDKPGIFHTKW
ncbi:MAG: NADP-dependent phosphogluconate dehydrogenase [Saccharofermentanales bacterium]